MIVIVVHGGAAKVPTHYIDGKMSALKQAVRAGYAVLSDGKSAMDAVEAAVRVMEDDPHFNCGYGSSLTTDGTVECDAIVMDGQTLNSGAIASVKRIKNPVSLARVVMERTDHCLLAGIGAEQFAKESGFELVSNESLVHEWAQKRLEDYKTFQRTINDDKPVVKQTAPEGHESDHDTVGAVAIDRDGNVAVATSTGGITAKRVGRVGDSPIIGAGGYADNTCGAVSTTGHGEAIMKTCLARYVMFDFMSGQTSKDGPKTLQESMDSSLEMMVKRVDGYGGAIAVANNGQIGIGFSTSMMPWAYVNSADTQPSVHFGCKKGEHLLEKL